MRLIQIIVICFCFFSLSHCTPMNLTLLNSSEFPDAKCLDGSQAGLYTQQGWGSGADKYMIFFQGGGACLAPTKDLIFINCWGRSKTSLGSSNSWSLQRNGNGIQSDEEKINSQFFNWNKIYVPYCDGACFQGYLPEPVSVLGDKIYFRGNNITTSIFSYVFKNFNISSASQVILTGTSAGGMGTFFWGNYLGSILSPQTQFLMMPDSGLFINYPEGSFFQQSIQAFVELTEISTIMPQGCPYLNNTEELYKCVMPQYFMNRIQHPILIVESEYDEWQLKNSQLVQCDHGKSLESCTQEQMISINNFRGALVQIIKDQVSSPKGKFYNWGAWAPACVQHGFFDGDKIYNSTNFQVAQNSGNNVQSTIAAWINSVNNSGSQVIHIDNVTWPGNAPCSGKKSFNQNEIILTE